MGKCLTIVKLVGVGSLGIATFAAGGALYALTRFQAGKMDRKPLLDLTRYVEYAIAGLGSVASYLFYTAFARAKSYEQHPYLLYAAMAFPVTLGAWYYAVMPHQGELKSNSVTKTVIKKEKKVVRELVPSSDEKSPLDDSTYGDLGNSEPIYKQVEVEVDVPTTVVVDLDSVSLAELTRKLKCGFVYCASALGLGLFISVVGFLGEA